MPAPTTPPKAFDRAMQAMADHIAQYQCGMLTGWEALAPMLDIMSTIDAPAVRDAHVVAMSAEELTETGGWLEPAQ